MSKNKTIITKALMKKFLLNKYPDCRSSSYYSEKIIDCLLESFPQRIKEGDIASILNISPRWLQVQCNIAFNTSVIKISRLLRVYNAVELLTCTNRSLSSIAYDLNYTQVSNMTRDFNKVLGLTPTMIKKNNLTNQQ